MQSLFAWLGCVSLLCSTCGCSSDESSGTPDSGGSGDETCKLEVKLEGALNQDVAWDLSEGCGGGADTAARSVALGWGGITTPLNFHLTLRDIGEGQLGQDFSTTARVKAGDSTWRTAEGACTVEVSRFELKGQNSVGKSYSVWGSGSCSAGADAAEGGAQGSITIGPFVFRSSILYAD
jgi:hypothetical protein